MRNFFTEVNGLNFHIFGRLHIFLIVITIMCVVLIFVERDKLRKIKNTKNTRFIMTFILFINMTIYYLSKVLLGTYNWKVDLPLHFCFITGYIFMFTLITNNEKIFKMIYFFTFVGPIPAILLPDLSQSYNRYIFWQFVISHHVMLIFSVYALVVFRYKINKKDIYKALVFGNVMVGLVVIFNMFFKTNYIMINELPEHIYRLFSFVKYMPPLFWLELTAILVLYLAYIPVYILSKIDNTSEKEKILLIEKENCDLNI